MRDIRRASATTRLAVALVATCALLLHAMAGAGPLRLLLAGGDLTCTSDRTRDERPARPAPRHDCSCCTIECGSSGCGLPTAAVVGLVARIGETVPWLPGERQDLNFPPVVHFAARGPPSA